MNYDTAFCLEIDEKSKNTARDIIKSFSQFQQKIIISPSRVVEQECEKVGIDFRKELLLLINLLAKKNCNVLLLAHSLRNESKSKNNDIELCEFFVNNAKSKNVLLLPYQEDSRVLREIIGSADIFIGCRFHSIVSALSKGVPTITLAWSHKYQEMISPFNIGQYVLDSSKVRSGNILRLIENIEHNLDLVKGNIKQNLPTVINSSQGNFKIVIKYLLST
jgi:colanic acid/amylovoran biosynthesis protein